ncbi:PTS sugar transporter subunit IIB [Metabacillus sp. GX 13764]|uniref:PTS sugar transporter subunit IIB n=1 Tax=Metabacillus kandeliae TaxID=2900151 RepID=UPI001E3E9590|nr:PTS sugar transporter subunit IIB [Metabacillus kandeliae]
MKILLCCAAGMSSSLLVAKMKKSAEELGMECEIWAIPTEAVSHQIHQADVLLLGPHVRYLMKDFMQLGEENHVPVGLIKAEDYGTFNGEKVLRQAMELRDKG